MKKLFISLSLVLAFTSSFAFNNENVAAQMETLREYASGCYVPANATKTFTVYDNASVYDIEESQPKKASSTTIKFKANENAGVTILAAMRDPVSTEPMILISRLYDAPKSTVNPNGLPMQRVLGWVSIKNIKEGSSKDCDY